MAGLISFQLLAQLPQLDLNDCYFLALMAEA